MSDERPSTFQIWWTATRPHTLTAGVSPCLVAYALCRPSWDLQLAWTIFCITVQIGTNLHNDYSDFVQGADTEKRVGHARATAKGWLTPMQTCQAATFSLSITFTCGLYLARATDQLSNPIVWFLILSSIFNAFAYTAGPYPLGYIGLDKWSIAYSGLGEVFVMLYFGYTGTLMLPYLLYCKGIDIPWSECFVYATAVGLLATNIIIVNNLRDRLTDVLVDKRTTAVRFGRQFMRLLPLLIIPIGIREARAVMTKEGESLNKHVGGAAMHHLDAKQKDIRKRQYRSIDSGDFVFQGVGTDEISPLTAACDVRGLKRGVESRTDQSLL
eukprot:scaffold3077_cov162-Amphora_coffeaeformis.AAC.44